MAKHALIIGVTGQDGSFLAEFLAARGYQVSGIARHVPESPLLGVAHFLKADSAIPGTLDRLLLELKPDEIYNLASMSRPGESWDQAHEAMMANAAAAQLLFDAARLYCPQARIFHASSSDMYGNAEISPQDESTAFAPNNPYALAKHYAHCLAGIYRARYGQFISCGIMFNHESARRPLYFVVQKICFAAACLSRGISDAAALDEAREPILRGGKIRLGNLAASRDWGYAPDYVRAIHAMLQADTAEDYVIGTGILRSVEEACEAAFCAVDLNWRDHVTLDPRLVRPVDTQRTMANAAKAKHQLGWAPSVDFDTMIRLMVKAQQARLSERQSA